MKAYEIIFRQYRVILRPKTKISKKESNELKDRIRKRLQREDYRCKLPGSFYHERKFLCHGSSMSDGTVRLRPSGLMSGLIEMVNRWKCFNLMS